MRAPRPHGLSLLELLLALSITCICTVSIYDSVMTTSKHAVQLDVTIAGRMLAHSILDQALDRFYVEDSRFFTLDTPPAKLHQAISRGEWKKPFLDLACPKTPVIARDQQASPYFHPQTGPALPLEVDDAEERRFWRSFSYQVEVDFKYDRVTVGENVPLDSDGDGQGEVDLGRVKVSVFHESHGREITVCTFSSLVSIRDKTPGLGVLSGI